MSNTYKLYFYTKTKNADAAVNATKNLSITFGSNNYDVILLKLKYTKKTYQPCEINATLTVDARKVTENEKTTYYLPTNSEIETAFLNKTVDMDIDGCLAATNYFVYSVKPIYNGVSGTSMTVELGIYSADKLMTLDKYSRAYTAKRLYTDILATESSMFHLNDDSDSSK